MTVNKTDVQDNKGTVTNLSVTMNGTGIRRLAVAILQMNSSSSGVTMTYDGVSMIQAAIQESNDQRTFLHYLINPNLGSKTVTANWGSSRHAIFGCITYENVQKFSSLRAISGSSGNGVGNQSVVVTSEDKDIVVAAMTSAGNVSLITGEQQQWDETQVDVDGAAAHTHATGSSTTLTFHTAGGNWSILGASFKEDSRTKGSQILIMASKMRDFYEDLKLGLIPPKELQRKYQEIWI